MHPYVYDTHILFENLHINNLIYARLDAHDLWIWWMLFGQTAIFTPAIARIIERYDLLNGVNFNHDYERVFSAFIWKNSLGMVCKLLVFFLHLLLLLKRLMHDLFVRKYQNQIKGVPCSCPCNACWHILQPFFFASTKYFPVTEHTECVQHVSSRNQESKKTTSEQFIWNHSLPTPMR